MNTKLEAASIAMVYSYLWLLLCSLETTEVHLFLKLYQHVFFCAQSQSALTLANSHERQQLPLKLAHWAITIHKSQGLTLPKAWNDISQTERTAGIPYVAISRVRTLSSFVIEPMSYERLKTLKKSINLNFRLEEEHRLQTLAMKTLLKVSREAFALLSFNGT